MTNRRQICFLFLAIQMRSAPLVSPETAFDTLAGLQGDWSIQSEGKTLPIKMSYGVGSKNSVVTERFGKELSVFYRDGSDLLMTHFCNAGNQPRLRLKKDSQPGLWVFEMFDITNLKDPSANHVQRIVYRVVNPTRIELEIIWQKDKTQDSERYILSKLSDEPGRTQPASPSK